MNYLKITVIALVFATAAAVNASGQNPPPPKEGHHAAAMKEAREDFLANKVAFFTGSYVIFIPFFSWLIYKKRPAFDNVGLYGGDSRSRTDDPLLGLKSFQTNLYSVLQRRAIL